MRKKIYTIITSVALVCIMFAIPCLISVNNARLMQNMQNSIQTRTITANDSLNFDNLYNQLNETCQNIEYFYNEDAKVFNLTATQIIPMSVFDEIDNVSFFNAEENVSVTYTTSYDVETNLVALIANSNSTSSDTLYGCPFTTDNGEIDVAFYADGDIIYLSELQESGVIQNCGWFARFLKKLAKVIVKVAVVAVATALVAVAAPVVATVAGTVVAGAAITTATTIATTAAATAVACVTIAGAAELASIAAEIIESADGSYTINGEQSIKIGAEKKDKSTINLIEKIVGVATFATLREMTRSYHIAFAVSQKFSEDGIKYSIGDLYISKLTLTFDEAYCVLIQSGMINTINEITNNKDIIDALSKVVLSKELQALVENLKIYKTKGYFSNKVQGIYADSVEAAATLASVTGAWFKGDDAYPYGYGGMNGYNHMHDLLRKIHIWYGYRIYE